MRSRRRETQLALGTALALLVVTPACQSVNSEVATLLADGKPAATATPPSAAEGRKYSVEFRATGRQPQLAEFPLPDVLYIQQALEQSGALKKFRRVKVEVYRQLPGGGGHRLDIPFDRAKRTIPPSADYAVRPNDRIVVTEDSSTIIDDMMESLSGKTGK